MPTYLVTDTTVPTQIMVEADRKASAIAHVVNERFEVGEALTVRDAMKLREAGVDFVDANSEPSLQFDGPTEYQALQS